jgi:hypothetical protein
MRRAQLESEKAEASQNQPIKIMNKPISLALVVGGIILIICGVSASDSTASGVSRFFTGNPTDKTMWLLIGGAIATVVGAVGLFRGSKAP